MLRWLITGILLFPGGGVYAQTTSNNPVVIGVLAYNGKQQALKRWTPTADYLSQHIPGYQFQIKPLAHVEFGNLINKGQLDFILTNPGQYIRLEVSFGATRIATFKSRIHNTALTHFSSVLFSRKNSAIKSIQALKGHTLAAVSADAFGGYQLVQKMLLDKDIKTEDDLKMLWFGFPQTDIVKAVRDGKADAGIVRTGILEKLALQGEINLADFQVLNKKTDKNFPLLHSTQLYPEWPIARLPGTDENLAKKVTITLLQMPENSPPAISSGGAGWTIPLDYTIVHTTFKALQVAPYLPVPLELKDFWQSYRHWVFLLIFLFFITLTSILFILRINRRLKKSRQTLFAQQNKLEATVKQRTAELIETNQKLQQDIQKRIEFEDVLHHGCDALQALYAISIRYDLTREQRLQSIVDLGRQHLASQVALLSKFDGKTFQTIAASPVKKAISAPLFAPLANKAIKNGQIINAEDKAQ